MIINHLLLLTQILLVVAALLILGLLSSPVGGIDKNKFHEKKIFLDRNLSDPTLMPQRILMYLQRYLFLYFLYRWDVLILVCLLSSAFSYMLYLMIRGTI